MDFASKFQHFNISTSHYFRFQKDGLGYLVYPVKRSVRAGNHWLIDFLNTVLGKKTTWWDSVMCSRPGRRVCRGASGTSRYIVESEVRFEVRVQDSSTQASSWVRFCQVYGFTPHSNHRNLGGSSCTILLFESSSTLFELSSTLFGVLYQLYAQAFELLLLVVCVCVCVCVFESTSVHLRLEGRIGTVG